MRSNTAPVISCKGAGVGVSCSRVAGVMCQCNIVTLCPGHLPSLSSQEFLFLLPLMPRSLPCHVLRIVSDSGLISNRYPQHAEKIEYIT